MLGILNSKVIYFWLFHRGKRKGNTLELYHTPLSNIPIKIGKEDTRIQIANIVLNIIGNLNENIPAKEFINKLDALIYSLYGLTEEEIAIVEESVKS